jgi:lipocalin
MYKTITLTMALALLGVSMAAYSSGSCPKIQLQENFDATKYVGTWFEHARDKGMPWESGNCQQARYSLKEDGSLKVFNT